MCGEISLNSYHTSASHTPHVHVEPWVRDALAFPSSVVNFVVKSRYEGLQLGRLESKCFWNSGTRERSIITIHTENRSDYFFYNFREHGHSNEVPLMSGSGHIT